ncbi:MAG: DNA recombination/repair protein RecA [Myxococcota bacterium]
MSRLQEALRAASLRYGTSAPDDDEFSSIPVLSTGIVPLDGATGCGGLPRGRLTELFGPPGCGKTAVALRVVAQAQHRGTVAFIDADRTFSPKRASQLGVKLPTLLVCQPEDGRQAMTMAEQLTVSGALALVVVDSAIGLAPLDASEQGPASVLSVSLRSLCAHAYETGTTLLFLNQLGQRPGICWGRGEDAAEGDALKFHSTLRLELWPRAALYARGEVVGARLRVRAVKNRLRPPYGRALFDLRFADGVISSV